MLPPTASMLSRTISRFETLRTEAPQIRFSGSHRHVGGIVERRRHLVGVRHHHQLGDALEAPVLHELDRHPVEQFRMRRRIAHLAEVLERRHDAAAEMFLPQTIDDHARRHRILRTTRSTARARAGVPRSRPSGRGISVGGLPRVMTSMKPGVISDPWLSTSPRIRNAGRRRLVAARPLLQVRPGARHRDRGTWDS